MLFELKMLLFKTVLFSYVFIVCDAVSGEANIFLSSYGIFNILSVKHITDVVDRPCTGENNTAGICTDIRRCPSAIDGISNADKLQCGYLPSNRLVCCITELDQDEIEEENITTLNPTEVYDESSSETSDDDYSTTSTISTTEKEYECPAAPNTAEQTGQKAFDKCIEYQQKYVYPCEIQLFPSVRFMRKTECIHGSQVIPDGDNTTLVDINYMVRLGYGENLESAVWLCPGNVISENFILTAAKCATIRDHGDVKYIQTVNPDDNTTTVYLVKRSIRHPDYDPTKFYHNIALVETEKPLNLSKTLVPACLHVGRPVKDERAVTVGKTKQKKMQKVALTKMPTEECSSKLPKHRMRNHKLNGTHQLCYIDEEDEKNELYTEKGNALHIENPDVSCMYLVLGIKSLGFFGVPTPGSSARITPMIFTKLSAYIPWIESIVWPEDTV